MVFPADQAVRSRHERVFPANLSARTAWRAVQVQRIVLKALGASAKASTGATKSFYINARWLVLAAIFNRIKPEGGEVLALSPDVRKSVSAAVADYAEKLLAQAVAKGFASYDTTGGAQILTTPRDFQSVFKTQADCETLFAALKAEIWKDQAAAVEPLAEGVA